MSFNIQGGNNFPEIKQLPKQTLPGDSDNQPKLEPLPIFPDDGDNQPEIKPLPWTPDMEMPEIKPLLDKSDDN